jgi:hypothetical protein
MNRHELNLYIELYKRKQFDKIPVFKDSRGYYFLSKPQISALEYLWDDTCFYVGFGGSGMSGKTQLECFYALFNCLAYPDTRWLIGRAQLKNLEATTFQTMHKTLRFYGLKKDEDYKYDGIKKSFLFKNTSLVIGKDTSYAPSDPLFTDLGGLELTGAILDESVENVLDVINILTTRVNRWNNGKYNIKAKILEGFNPAKNHVHRRYWKPYRDNEETTDTKFVRALCTDNPHPDAKEWAKNVLKTGDKRTIERLYYGNFDYDDDDDAIIDFNKINDLFFNTFVESGEMFISSDIAITNDRFVVAVWEGMRLKELSVTKNASKPVERLVDNITTNVVDYSPLINEFERLSIKWKVPRSNIVFDAGGIGKNVKEYLSGAVPLHTGIPAQHPDYGVLRDELLYKLAEIINSNEMFIDCYVPPEIKERLIEELQVIKRRSKVGEKLKVITTDDIKKLIGHSPDIAVTLAYRMLFKITRNK